MTLSDYSIFNIVFLLFFYFVNWRSLFRNQLSELWVSFIYLRGALSIVDGPHGFEVLCSLFLELSLATFRRNEVINTTCILDASDVLSIKLVMRFIYLFIDDRFELVFLVYGHRL